MEQQHLTGLEEATIRIGKALELAQLQLNEVSWFKFKRKAYMHGAIYALALTYNLLHTLVHKHDNSGGELN